MGSPYPKHTFFAAERPLVFAHRGGSALAPENTLAAFEEGVALGADGIELDVHLSRDGVPVVQHDALLDRTTNLRGPIGSRTADELARADAGFHFRVGDAFPFRGRDIGIPTLASVLARCSGVRVIVELKGPGTDLARAVVAAIRAAGAVDRVCVGSFDLAGLRVVRTLEPAIATSAARSEVVLALARLWCGGPIHTAPFRGYQVPERSGAMRVVSRRFVEAAHRAGLGVHVWTVNTPEHARRLLALGVDGLITDRPDLLVPLIRELHR